MIDSIDEMIEIRIFDAMVDALRDTKLFLRVEWSRYDTIMPGDGANVLITRTGFDHDLRAANVDDLDRRIPYLIRLEYNDNDIDYAKRYIIYLEGVVINTFNQQKIGGLTIAGKTFVTRGRDDPDAPANAVRTMIEGFFTFSTNHLRPVRLPGDP